MSTVELTPEKMVAGGEALARDADGRVVMIEGAVPGEAVRVEILTAKGQTPPAAWDHGFITIAPRRRTPRPPASRCRPVRSGIASTSSLPRAILRRWPRAAPSSAADR